MINNNGYDHDAEAEARARAANEATGRPFLTTEEFDAAVVEAKRLENKLWDLITTEKASIHVIAMLGGSLAGRIQAVICNTKEEVKPELLALHANVYWQAYHVASKLIPRLLIEAQLAALMEEIGKDAGEDFDNLRNN